jgi:hypothetical protein
MTSIKNTMNISTSIRNDSNYHRNSFTISTDNLGSGYVSRELCTYLNGGKLNMDLCLKPTQRESIHGSVWEQVLSDEDEDVMTVTSSLSKLIHVKVGIKLIGSTIVDLLLATHFFSEPEVRQLVLKTNHRRESFTMSTDMEGSGYASRELSSYLNKEETTMETILLPVTRKLIEQQRWRRIMNQTDFVRDEDSGGDTHFHWLPAKLAAFMGRDPDKGIMASVIVHTIVTYHFFLEPEVYTPQPLVGRDHGCMVWDEKTCSMVWRDPDAGLDGCSIDLKSEDFEVSKTILESIPERVDGDLTSEDHEVCKSIGV